MSPAAYVAAVAQHAGHGLHSRWTRCGRRIQWAIGILSTAATLISGALWLGSAVSTQAAAFVHNEVVAQIQPVISKMDDLHNDVVALKTGFVTVSTASVVNAELKSQLDDIKALLQSLQKKPAPNTQR